MQQAKPAAGATKASAMPAAAPEADGEAREALMEETPATAAKPRSTVSTAITVVVCLVFTAVGPMLILINKYLMARGSFPYPIILTCFGQVRLAFRACYLHPPPPPCLLLPLPHCHG